MGRSSVLGSNVQRLPHSGLAALRRPGRQTSHVGWLPVGASSYTLDYSLGFFPWSESSFASDAALLALGGLDATPFSHKLSDLAAPLPILEALGYGLYHWPDLAAPDRLIPAMFDEHHSCHNDLWLVCRNLEQASALSAAIRKAE